MNEILAKAVKLYHMGRENPVHRVNKPSFHLHRDINLATKMADILNKQG